jgi:hypothetical protein
MDIHQALAQEWATLQNNHEAQERNALLIKLLAVLLLTGTWLLALEPLLAAALLLVLWLQEAILKTWQARLAERLLVVEAMALRGPQGVDAPLQLHTWWLAQRPALPGLLAEYGRSALRPTVAFPYAILLVFLALL